MHCSKCKTVIDKAVLLQETAFGTEVEDSTPLLYCKKCFTIDFLNDNKTNITR
jgi:hypothetical protein